MAVSGTHDPVPATRGRWIFLALILVIGSLALWYALSTESMGIEERFSSALGIAHDGEEHGHEEGGGFALEGAPVLYAIILALICGACWLLYRKYGA